MQVQIDFIPNGQNVIKFIRLMAEQLQKLGFDISDDDIESMADAMRDAAIAAGSTADELGKVWDEIDAIKKTAKEGGKDGIFGKMLAVEGISRGLDALSAFSEKSKDGAESLKLLGLRSGATGAELEQLENSAAKVFGSSIGFETFGEATQAIATATATLKEFYSPEEIEQFTIAASGIAKAWDQDVNDVIRKSAPLVKNFGVSAEEAAGLVGLIAQSGGSDDVLDTFNEYSQVLKSAFSEGETGAQEFTAVLINGLNQGVRDTDKLADAIKESQLRINEGLASADLTSLSGPTADAIRNVVEAGKAGQKSVIEVMQETARLTKEAVSSGEITNEFASQLQIAVAGTPAEDIGIDLYSNILSAPIDTNIIAQKAGEVNATLGDAIEPPNITDKIGRALEASFAGVAGAVGPALGPLTQVGTIMATMGPQAAEAAAGMLKYAVSILSKVVPGLGAQLAAQTATAVSAKALTAALLTNPFFLGGAAVILAAVTAFALFSDSTKSADEAVGDLNSTTEQYNQALEKQKSVNDATNGLRKLADEYDSLKDKTDPESQQRFAEVTNQLNAEVPQLANRVEELGNKGELLGTKYTFAAEEVRKFADEQDRAASEQTADAYALQTNAVEASIDTFRDLKDQMAETTAEKEKFAALSSELGADEGGGIFGDSYGENLKESREELVKIGEDYDKVIESTREWIKAQIDSGKSIEEIAKASGATVEEINYIGGAMFAVEKNAAAVGGEMHKTGQEIRASATEAQKMGEAFNNALKASADFSSGAISALAQALFNLEAARKSGNALSIAQAEAQVKIFTDLSRTAVAGEKNMQRYLDEANKISGKVIKTGPTSRTPQQKRALEIAEYVEEILKELKNESDLRAATGEFSLGLEEIAQKEAAALEQLSEKAKEFREKIAESKKAGSNITFTKEDETALKELEAGGKAQLETAKKFAEERKQFELDFFRDKLKEQRDAELDANQKQISDLRNQADRINAVTEEAYKKKIELLLKAAILEQQTEEKGIVQNNDRYLELYAERARLLNQANQAETEDAKKNLEAQADAVDAQILAQEKLIRDTAAEMKTLRDLEAELSITVGETERAELQKRIDEQRSAMGEINSTVKESAEDLLYSLIAYADEEKDIRADLAAYTYNQAVTKLKRTHADQTKELEDQLETLRTITDAIRRVTEVRGEEFISGKESERLAELERARSLELLTEESFNAKRLELEAAFQSERDALAARSEGVALETERQAQLKTLLQQEQQLKEEILLAQQAGDVTQENTLRDQLAETQAGIEQQGSLLLASSKQIQEGVTEIFSNLFSGDVDNVKAPFKKLLFTMLGALQQMASLKITEVIIGSILGPLGIGGVVAAIGLRPAIQGLINSLLNPLVQSIQSFEFGSGPLTTPQLAIIGDAPVPERVLRDDQLEWLLNRSAAIMAGMIIPYLKDIVGAVITIPNKMNISRRELTEEVEREKIISRRYVVI